MLVLTRKKEQSIIIGENVEIMVLGVSGDKVRLGITAPREVDVFRKEVIDERGSHVDGSHVDGSHVEAEQA
ncbi:MAG: carbon storage regulator CsrA [Solirubrobacterales bacterium]|nr:carbon storage regulator CsrA [Solirubrobacterales bacterium]HRV61058.1 carbon storage regulator CsrA [Solirubrobacterales bacterium]